MSARPAGVPRSGSREAGESLGSEHQLGVTGALEDLGIEVIYWGEPITALLREKAPLLTIRHCRFWVQEASRGILLEACVPLI
jgi:hypothetical protein